MESTQNTDLLNIASQYNYWKPYQFFFRYFQLREYEKCKIELKNPFLELGSGDGTFTRMLFDLKKIKDTVISTDYNHQDLVTAKNNLSGNYARLDVCNLPFKNESVNTVFSNGVLCCLFSKLDKDVESVVKEGYRVLKGNGIFIISVATNYFNENLSTYNLLKKLRLNSIANWYIKKFEARLTHHNVYKIEKWLNILERNGFKIENVGNFFSPKQGFWYGILSLKIFNLYSFVKLIPSDKIKKLSADLLRSLFKNLINSEYNDSGKISKPGYIVIFAKKNI